MNLPSFFSNNRKEQDDLQQKLRHLEAKLIVGGENLLDKAEKQARLLEESEKELEKRVQNEEELRKELQQKEVFVFQKPILSYHSSLG
jgi:kinesin family protein 3/17